MNFHPGRIGATGRLGLRARLLAGVAVPPAPPPDPIYVIEPPAAFAASWPGGALPFEVRRQGGVVTTTYDIAADKPAITGTTFYVDATRPDDTGDGLTPATAKRSMRSGIILANAAGAGVHRIIVATGDVAGLPRVYWGSNAWPGTGVSVSLVIETSGVNRAVSAPGPDGPAAPVWTLDSGAVFRRTGITTKPAGLVDYADRDAEGWYFRPAERASLAEVQAEAGTWYWDDPTDTLYVRTRLSRTTDMDYVGRLGPAANVFRHLTSSTADLTLYCNAKMDFVGGISAVKYFPASGTSNIYLGADVTADMTGDGNDNVYMVAPGGGGHARMLCRGRNGRQDIFSYGNSSGTSSPVYVLEQSVVARGGVLIDSAADNLSTGHSATRIVRVAGDYRHSEGRLIHDVQGGFTWIVGGSVGPSKWATPGVDSAIIRAGGSGSGAQSTWLDLVTWDQSDADNLDLVTSDAVSAIYVSRSTPAYASLRQSLFAGSTIAEYTAVEAAGEPPADAVLVQLAGDGTPSPTTITTAAGLLSAWASPAGPDLLPVAGREPAVTTDGTLGLSWATFTAPGKVASIALDAPWSASQATRIAFWGAGRVWTERSSELGATNVALSRGGLLIAQREQALRVTVPYTITSLIVEFDHVWYADYVLPWEIVIDPAAATDAERVRLSRSGIAEESATVIQASAGTYQPPTGALYIGAQDATGANHGAFDLRDLFIYRGASRLIEFNDALAEDIDVRSSGGNLVADPDGTFAGIFAGSDGLGLQIREINDLGDYFQSGAKTWQTQTNANNIFCIYTAGGSSRRGYKEDGSAGDNVSPTLGIRNQVLIRDRSHMFVTGEFAPVPPHLLGWSINFTPLSSDLASGAPRYIALSDLIVQAMYFETNGVTITRHASRHAEDCDPIAFSGRFSGLTGYDPDAYPVNTNAHHIIVRRCWLFGGQDEVASVYGVGSQIVFDRCLFGPMHGDTIQSGDVGWTSDYHSERNHAYGFLVEMGREIHLWRSGLLGHVRRAMEILGTDKGVIMDSTAWQGNTHIAGYTAVSTGSRLISMGSKVRVPPGEPVRVVGVSNVGRQKVGNIKSLYMNTHDESLFFMNDPTKKQPGAQELLVVGQQYNKESGGVARQVYATQINTDVGLTQYDGNPPSGTWGSMDGNITDNLVNAPPVADHGRMAEPRLGHWRMGEAAIISDIFRRSGPRRIPRLIWDRCSTYMDPALNSQTLPSFTSDVNRWPDCRVAKQSYAGDFAADHLTPHGLAWGARYTADVLLPWYREKSEQFRKEGADRLVGTGPGGGLTAPPA